VFIVLFFSASSSKLPAYILPVFPAIALLLGERLTRVDAVSFGRHTLFLAAAGAVIAALAPQVVRFASEVSPEPLYRGYVPWIAAAGIALLAGAIGARMLARRGRTVGAVVALGLGGLAMTQLALTGHEALSPSQSAWHLVQRAKPALQPDVPFYSVGTYEQTLPFYIGRTVTQVAFLDELAFGIEQEPHLWVPTLAEFERRWRAHDRALAIMNPDVYEQLKQAKLPMKEVARDTRRVIVSKP
jgi:4-amino-4-deoxy-L-arabinose transferase-like glycosyltransferase